MQHQKSLPTEDPLWKKDCVQCLAGKGSTSRSRKMIKTAKALAKKKKLNINMKFKNNFKKPKSVNLKSSRLRKPFKLGWKRVAVKRYESDTTFYYVRYISPTGKRCRTWKQLRSESKTFTKFKICFFFIFMRVDSLTSIAC